MRQLCVRPVRRGRAECNGQIVGSATIAKIHLTRKWTKVAQAGDCVYLTNVGLMPVILSTADRLLPPGSSALHAALPANLSACAARGVTELAVTVTPGLLSEEPGPRIT